MPSFVGHLILLSHSVGVRVSQELTLHVNTRVF
jgi:hypothetical protein